MSRMSRVGAAAAIVVAGVLALAWAYSYGGSADPGVLDRTGPAVTWGLPLGKLVFNLACACTIGTLVLAVFALPRNAPVQAAALRFAGWSATVWAAAAAIYTGASFLFIANRPVSAGFGPEFVSFLTDVEAGRAGTLTAVMAAAVALACFCLEGPHVAAIVALPAFAGLVPLVLRSHATGGAGHADATTALILHTGTAAVWIGGLLALIMLRTSLPARRLSPTVQRYSTLALICYTALTVSGVLAAVARIRSVDDLLSPYGVIILAKAAALIGLGVFGALHRRWTLKRLDRDPHRAAWPFLRLAVAELAVMGAASGMAAALARTAPPAPVGAPTANPELLPEPGIWAYISQWAPDALWVLVCGFAVFFYFAGVRRLRAAGRSWPAHRTVLWLAGNAVLFTVTNGGLHIYQGLLFDTHVLTQMMLTAVVPLLLVPAAPLTLAELAIRPRTDGSTGAREFLTGTRRHFLTPLGRDPYLAVLILTGSVFAIYYSPLSEWSASSQLGYSTMTLLALLAGCLFMQAVTDPRNLDTNPASRLVLVLAAGVLYEVNGWWLSTQAFTTETPWSAALSPSSGTPTSPVAGSAGTIMWSTAAMTLGVVASMVVARRNSATETQTAKTGRPGSKETVAAERLE
ncbi:cytochrome c oxidase assembly protein [Pseudarthrobacter sp. O4]|uniref:cytochrome c oxidase assembly protein n=1 Tax=Pseudarthrobacter sp. O4 TaxID=3418417 RepID=UPI003CF509E2